jgi:hypothetical protein
MSNHDPVRSAGTGLVRVSLAKTAVIETVQTLGTTARDVLLAYAMTGSAAASRAIIAGPHLEMLLRRVFHGPSSGRAWRP